MRSLFLMVLIVVGSARALFACDICGVYSAAEAYGEIGKGIFLGVSEQYTHFGTIQVDGDEIPNTADQFLDSSNTQLLLGYNFTKRFGLQFNAPILYRSFRRVEDGVTQNGTVSGLGDVSLVGSYVPVFVNRQEFTLDWHIIGGVKFPTGNTSKLQEELNETEPVPGETESAVHGHDLTLGTGSYDGVLGTGVFTRWNRFFLQGTMQYTFRTEGAYDYQFADEITWSAGPGAFLLLDDEHTLTLQLACSGDHKGLDTNAGESAEDTGITTVYLGPVIGFTWSSKLSALLAADFPVSINNTALQIVPDWRVRAALTWHF